MKRACEMRSCQAKKVQPSQTLVFDETSSAEEIFKRAWMVKVAGSQVEKEIDANLQWGSWLKKQEELKKKTRHERNALQQGDKVSQAPQETPQAPHERQALQLGDLGFACTKRSTPFPALLLSSSRVAGGRKVMFFCTREVLIVSESNWTPYSEEVTARLLQDHVVNRGAFSSAVVKMQALAADIIKGQNQGTPREGNALQFDVQISISKIFEGRGRHLVPMTARSLAEDENFNRAAFASKMSMAENTWKCVNCPSFSSKLMMVAKRHARLCGERPKLPKERSSAARHPCSACPEKFKTKTMLKSHYRSITVFSIL